MFKRFIVVLSILLFISALFPLFLFAQEDDNQAPKTQMVEIKYEKINPNDGVHYDIKRLKEKIKLMLFSFFPKKKPDLYSNLSGVRLAELKYVIENNDAFNFEKATQRYYTIAGQWSEFLIKHNMGAQKTEAQVLLSSYIPLLENLRDKFNPTTAEWRFMEDDVNYTKIYIDQLQK